MTNKKTYKDQIIENKTGFRVAMSQDERMRILANLMIDRILADYRTGHLKYVTESSNLIMEHNNRDRK